MFDSNFLDVAIGLAMFFLFISLMCSAVREGIAAIARARAADLERGIRNLFNDQDGSGATRQFFNHPRIAALFLGRYEPTRLQPSLQGVQMPREHRRELPSYIPAEQFSTTVMDIVAAGRSAAGVAALTATELRAAAEAFPNEAMKRSILSALDATQDDLVRVRANLEQWFNDAMDRVSGWYKQRTQLYLFLIGFAVAGLFNLDAIDVGRQLQTSAALRDAVVAAGGALERIPEPATLDEAVEQFGALGYSTGWGECREHPRACVFGDGRPILPMVSKVAGWLITALAVTLGAPFWFDLLNKFMTLRSAIKPRRPEPARAPEPPAAAPPTPTPAPATAARPGAVAGAVISTPLVAHQWKDGDAEEGLL